MPKLSPDQRAERLTQTLNDIRSGRQLNDRELNQKLEPDEQQMLIDKWREQQQIRKNHRSAASAAKAGLEWKTKDQVRLEVVHLALKRLEDNFLSNLKAEQRKAEIRVAKKFLDTYLAVVEQNQLKGTRQDPLATANNAVRTLKNKHGHRLQPGKTAVSQHYRDHGTFKGLRDWEKLQDRKATIEEQERAILGDEAYETKLKLESGEIWTEDYCEALEKRILEATGKK